MLGTDNFSAEEDLEDAVIPGSVTIAILTHHEISHLMGEEALGVVPENLGMNFIAVISKDLVDAVSHGLRREVNPLAVMPRGIAFISHLGLGFSIEGAVLQITMLVLAEQEP
jgi:hypothetical protein